MTAETGPGLEYENRLMHEINVAIGQEPILAGLKYANDYPVKAKNPAVDFLFEIFRNPSEPVRIIDIGKPTAGKTTTRLASERAEDHIANALGIPIERSLFSYDVMVNEKGMGARQVEKSNKSDEDQRIGFSEMNADLKQKMDKDREDKQKEQERAGQPKKIIQNFDGTAIGGIDPRDQYLTAVQEIAHDYVDFPTTEPRLIIRAFVRDVRLKQRSMFVRTSVTEELPVPTKGKVKQEKIRYKIPDNQLPSALEKILPPKLLRLIPVKRAPNESDSKFGKRIRTTYLRMARDVDIDRIDSEVRRNYQKLLLDPTYRSLMLERRDDITYVPNGEIPIEDDQHRSEGVDEEQIMILQKRRTDEFYDDAAYMEYYVQERLRLGWRNGFVIVNPLLED